MTIYFYDKTLDGLLTAVFDAYSRKQFPDRLLYIEALPPLFVDETHTVITSEESAQRVWNALEKRISKLACNMLTYAWLSGIEQCDELIFRYICKNFDSNQSIALNFGDADVLKLHQIAKKVGHEKHYMEMFVRFQKAKDGIFFAPINPVHNVLPLVVPHFSDRFSDQKWLIYDTKRRYGFFYDLNEAVEVTIENDEQLLKGKLADDSMASDEKLFQNLWREYFQSMAIKERINPRLQRQHMPKRFWKYLTEKQ